MFVFARMFIAITMFLVICNCDTKKNDNPSMLLLINLLTPTMGMFGDSIMALWPAEEQLKPFITIKNAFPVRTSSAILTVVKEDRMHYNACLYNSGINDYLGNYSPEDSAISVTIENQLQTLALLRERCDQILVINTWYVDLPWPTDAAIKLNLAMKQNIISVPRLDTESFILKSDLIDGGHLTDYGYSKLAKRTTEHFRIFFPWIDFIKR
jgi:hypothetical protein